MRSSLGYGVIYGIVARLMKGRYHALVIVMTVVIGVRAMTANTTKDLGMTAIASDPQNFCETT
jgi:hypothetical protein